MTIPTGLGLSKGIEAADLPGTPLPSRVARAKANNAAYSGKDMQPDPCYCGCCNMERSAF